MLKNVDDNVLIVGKVTIEQGMSSSGGIGSPDVKLAQFGEIERIFSVEDRDKHLYDNDNWTISQDSGYWVNSVPMLLIDSSVSEEWEE